MAYYIKYIFINTDWSVESGVVGVDIVFAQNNKKIAPFFPIRFPKLFRVQNGNA